MPEYMFDGSLELRGVTFFVTADNENEARRRAAYGEYDHYETDSAETYDSRLDPNSVEINE